MLHYFIELINTIVAESRKIGSVNQVNHKGKFKYLHMDRTRVLGPEL